MCVTRLKSPATRLALATMGAAAFSLLLSAEFALAVLAFGRSAAAYVADFRTVAGVISLAAQLGFALLPLAQNRPLR